MVGFAGAEITLCEKMEDGSTLRDHLMSQWRQDFFAPEKMPEQLAVADCPESVRYLWEYFLNMSLRRTSNGYGLNPITHEGLEAWERRHGIRLLPFEHLAIEQLESVFLGIRNKPKKEH